MQWNVKVFLGQALEEPEIGLSQLSFIFYDLVGLALFGRVFTIESSSKDFQKQRRLENISVQ